MLVRVALHDELAELRTTVGPQVFDDPVTFRAAFDDFIPEGSASTGEVSLLVGAIATGALQRLKEQLALGADPEMTIAAQGDVLARDRGTTESSGARWALSVLAHAIEAVPADLVLTRPTPGPDSIGTAPADDATATRSAADPTRTVGQDPADHEPTQTIPPNGPVPPAVPSRRTNPLLVGGVAVLAIVAVVAVVLLFLREDDPGAGAADDSADDASSAATADPSGDEEVLATLDIDDAAEPLRVQLVHDDAETHLVLLLERDGELAEVDREPTACPFLESSYEAGIQHAGDLELAWGWQNLDQEGFGEYGRVVLELERLESYGVDDGYVCPTE